MSEDELWSRDDSVQWKHSWGQPYPHEQQWKVPSCPTCRLRNLINVCHFTKFFVSLVHKCILGQTICVFGQFPKTHEKKWMEWMSKTALNLKRNTEYVWYVAKLVKSTFKQAGRLQRMDSTFLNKSCLVRVR